MNEGFSDIWGACIEFSAAPTKSTWLMVKISKEELGIYRLRSMSNPPKDSREHLRNYWYAGTADSGGVHTNSGF
jgi:Zn-dependent metalloprotease